MNFHAPIKVTVAFQFTNGAGKIAGADAEFWGHFPSDEDMKTTIEGAMKLLDSSGDWRLMTPQELANAALQEKYPGAPDVHVPGLPDEWPLLCPCPVFALALRESLGGDEAKIQAIKDWLISPEKRRMFWHGGLGKTLLSQVIEEAAHGLGLTVVEQSDPNGVLFLRGDAPSVSEPWQPTLTIEFVRPSSKASRSDLANDLAAELPGIRSWLGLPAEETEG